jgi:membrane fusion protein (multidrug efflux system)
VAVLGPWLGWFLLAPVAVYEVTGSARLEAPGVARPVVSLREERVVANYLSLGREVEAGELLVQLDDREPRLAMETCRKRLAALQGVLDGFEEEFGAERRTQIAHAEVGQATRLEQRQYIEKAKRNTDYDGKRLKRLQGLQASRAVSAEELEQAEASATLNRLQTVALEATLNRREAEHSVEQLAHAARVAHLRRQRQELQVQIEEQQARLRELEYLVDRCQVRAPVAGRIGHLRTFPVGAIVSTREPLAYVVPEGKPRAVAFFPTAAGGRVRPGQPARLRLDGFPWTQYGLLPARVAQVANEAEQQGLRVELDVQADPGVPIPVEHGLPGSAEVEVEHARPAILVLRAIGRWLR